jgi:hypothetical protein
LTIVTWNNRPHRSPLEIFAERSGLRVLPLGRSIPRNRWRNYRKIELVLEKLRQADTKYLMAADAFDAVFIASPAVAVAELRACGADILFGAETGCHPPCPKMREFHSRLAPADSPFKFLNSGQFIARTDTSIDLFEEALSMTPRRIKRSDQDRWHSLFHRRSDRIALDYHCRAFQVYRSRDGHRGILQFVN